MFPYLVWWNPIIYFPWSGPVTQEIAPTLIARVEALEYRQKQLIQLAYKEHINRLSTLKPGEAKQEHTEEIKTLLKLMQSLNQEEYARILKEEGGT